MADFLVLSGQKTTPLPPTLAVESGVKPPKPLKAPSPEWNGVPLAPTIRPPDIPATLGVNPNDEA